MFVAMSELKRAIKLIKKHEVQLRDQFQVKELYLFGSIVRNELKKASDIDVLVEFSTQKIGLFEFVQLQDFLATLLGRPVDLVTPGAVVDWMKDQIERERVRAA
jgi:predicted nucleotidyltransferase